MTVKSNTLKSIYKNWQESATEQQIEFVDSVYALCEKNYSNGGDDVVEGFTPVEILTEFKSLNEVREYCGLRVEDATNKRWGEDSDPELARAERFRTGWED